MGLYAFKSDDLTLECFSVLTNIEDTPDTILS